MRSVCSWEERKEEEDVVLTCKKHLWMWMFQAIIIVSNLEKLNSQVHYQE